MINEKHVKRYCCEDISLIENYYEALNSSEKWDIHHRLETDLNISSQELIDTGRYFNVEAKYLIFLTHSEHRGLHNKGMRHTDAYKLKLSENNKGENNPMYKYVWSEEQRIQISDALKNCWNDEVIRNKYCESFKGRTPWNKGKKDIYSDETKYKMSVSHKGLIPVNKGVPQIKYKWLTSSGEIKEMDKCNVKRWHPDWIKIGEV